VLSTQPTEQAYRELVPQFEKATGHKVTTVFTGTLDADKRLAAGESYDMLIMSSGSIEGHIKDGKAAAGSRVDYVGPLPEAVQCYTVFASGIAAGAKKSDAAKALLKFLTAPAAAPAFKKQGMEPG
jgi:ABC-type molybdate transport system substrate-binding protein